MSVYGSLLSYQSIYRMQIEMIADFSDSCEKTLLQLGGAVMNSAWR